MRGRRVTKITLYFCNGWVIDKAPNSFAETHSWYASALDSEGYLIEKHGFGSLKSARAYCTVNNAPTTPKPVDADTLFKRQLVSDILRQN